MHMREAHDSFLQSAVDRLAEDSRVAAVVLVGSAGRGEADEWSDLDLVVIAEDDHSAQVLSNPHEAEQFGDLLVWVDCSFNAVVGGTMAFTRYGSEAGSVMVDWHVFPRATGRLTTGSRLLWSRSGVELERFAGGVVDLVSSHERRRTPPYSRQQRAEWELCMIDIAAARPPRGQDGRELHRIIGLKAEPAPSPRDQLDALESHLRDLQPWLAPRAFDACSARLEAARATLG
jgi:predicted nucleotidyltransferase